jgi:hypothetical protein
MKSPNPPSHPPDVNSHDDDEKKPCIPVLKGLANGKGWVIFLSQYFSTVAVTVETKPSSQVLLSLLLVHTRIMS